LIVFFGYIIENAILITLKPLGFRQITNVISETCFIVVICEMFVVTAKSLTSAAHNNDIFSNCLMI